MTVVLVLHASNFPSNRTTQMFISYQVSHHCLSPPYQIWGGTTVAEILERMKSKHIQGCMSKSVDSGWFLPPAQPLWGGFCTTGSSFELPMQENCWLILASTWSTRCMKGAVRVGFVHLEEEKAELRMGGLFLFVFNYLEKDYREHRTLLKLVQWNAIHFRRSYLDTREI